jgi:hypothetical protein
MANPAISDLPSLKKPFAIVDGKSPTSTVADDSDTEQEWTKEEENALVRKIDSIVMPLLMLAFFALQLDRGNMYVILDQMLG